eukprot:GHRR01022468.1.p1 GENE.GHRR01022468.1~~GHRR01022468.1.p1  ORF type:complete len:628 (+),score=193.17 GHRR01022468.1:312-2195(+)
MLSFLREFQFAKENNAQAHSGSETTSDSTSVGLGSLWTVANVVTSAVKQTAGEVVRSVQETDWKSELAAFTHEVEAEAHKAVEVVQHLPHHIPHSHTNQAGLSSSSNSPLGTPEASHAGRGDTLGAVGSTLAEFGKQLITGTKEVLNTVTDMVEGELATAAKEVPQLASGSSISTNSRATARLASRQRMAAKYSRFDAEVAAMQRDSATYCEEPEDQQDYTTWRSTSFSMTAAQQEIHRVLAGNAFMAELHSRIVPLIVEKEDFWARYFYRLHKLHQKKQQRQQLAARAKQLDEQEDLGGWDDDEPHSPQHRKQQQPQQAQQHTSAAQKHVKDSVVKQHMQPAAQNHIMDVADSQPNINRTAQQDAEPAATAPTARTQNSSTSSALDSSGVGATGAASPAGHEAHVEKRGGASVSIPEPIAFAAAANTEGSSIVDNNSGISGSAGQRCPYEDGSAPSTPLQTSSDASDVTPATDTTSDGSGSGAKGPAPHWTLVSPSSILEGQQSSGNGDLSSQVSAIQASGPSNIESVSAQVVKAPGECIDCWGSKFTCSAAIGASSTTLGFRTLMVLSSAACAHNTQAVYLLYFWLSRAYGLYCTHTTDPHLLQGHEHVYERWLCCCRVIICHKH